MRLFSRTRWPLSFCAAARSSIEESTILDEAGSIRGENEQSSSHSSLSPCLELLREERRLQLSWRASFPQPSVPGERAGSPRSTERAIARTNSHSFRLVTLPVRSPSSRLQASAQQLESLAIRMCVIIDP